MECEKLDEVQDWHERARRCRYRVKLVAQELNISTRWLQVHFQRTFNLNPHDLFASWRLQEVQALARTGIDGKKIAALVGFASYGNLSRNVQRYTRRTLGELRKGEPLR